MLEELVGRSLGRYQITELIAEGSIGATFSAHDTTLLRQVAVMVIAPQPASQPGFQARFLEEARTAARMDHPGIIRVYDFGQSETSFYVVMEPIAGQTLREHLDHLRAAGQSLPLDQAVEVVRQVSLALHYAQSQGVLHRDTRPEGITLKPEAGAGLPYRPVLTDLGLAKLLDAAAGGASMGAPAYMSPEQAMGDPTDARSDVYSLGVLLYELAVGRLPFAIRTLTEAIRYHTKEPPPPPRGIRSDLPEPLEQVILKALAKDPSARYADAAALASALAAAQLGAPAAATQAQPAAPAGRTPTQPAAPAADTPTGEPTGDTLTIIGPDGSVRSVAAWRGQMCVGRSAGNAIVLDYVGVEPQHARLLFEGGQCLVESLSQAGETYLASTRLLPGAPAAWAPEQVLRIGSVRLRLEPAPAAAHVERAVAQVAEPVAPVRQAPHKKSRIPIVLAVLAGVALLATVCVVLYAVVVRPLIGQGVAIGPQEPSATVLPRAANTALPTREPTRLATRAPTMAPTAARTATPPRTATPTPTIKPSPTPCGAAPAARFAAAYTRWQARIGCPAGAAVESFMAAERFEHGWLIWSEDSKQIYVLSAVGADTKWRQFPDTWAEGQPDHDPSLAPPPGLLQPVRGFGKVWRENLGGPGSVLGWAVEPEHGDAGARQPFTGGLIISGPGGTFALYENGEWESY